MNMENEKVKQYRLFAEQILTKDIKSGLIYHTIDHTRSVVSAFIEIGEGMNLSEKELELGQIAAWFHDTGYSVKNKLHEAESVAIFDKVRVEGDFSEEDVTTIHNLIMSTKIPQQPQNLLEQVLCDADLHNLGTESFFDASKKLKKEFENATNNDISKEKWNIDTYYFLQEHSYFTTYAIKKYGTVKKENIKQLRGKIKEFDKQDKLIKKLEAKLEKAVFKNENRPSRGIETMFRITSRNHLQLSSMADSKANIMISINTIVISVVISAYATKIGDYPDMILPVITLILVCLATIVLSVLATRPQISKGEFSKDDILSKKTNLLFFGNFHGMKMEDYEWGVSEMMKDPDYLYSSLTRDIFFLGKVLGRKYKILRLAYTTFMIGFVISILLFLITVYWKNPEMI